LLNPFKGDRQSYNSRIEKAKFGDIEVGPAEVKIVRQHPFRLVIMEQCLRFLQVQGNLRTIKL